MNGLPDASGDALVRSFLPLHKRAFGMATGLAAALIVFTATVIATLRGTPEAQTISLLGEYFAGYTVSWQGAFIGALWGAFTGFNMGWFLAFSRNVFVAVFIAWVRTKAELAQTRDFLDHI